MSGPVQPGSYLGLMNVLGTVVDPSGSSFRLETRHKGFSLQAIGPRGGPLGSIEFPRGQHGPLRSWFERMGQALADRGYDMAKSLLEANPPHGGFGGAYALVINEALNPRANQRVIWIYFPHKRRPISVTASSTFDQVAALLEAADSGTLHRPAGTLADLLAEQG